MSDVMTSAVKVEPGSIFGLMPKVMAAIGAIGKGRKNQQQGYSFRGIDDVYNAIHDALAENQVFPVPRVLEQKREERPSKSGGLMFHVVLLVETRFYAPDGSSVSAVTVGEAMDSSDKASNKAMSAAMKYALLETFCIPTEESKDTEDGHPEVAPVPMSKRISPAPTRDAGPPAPLGSSLGGGRTSTARHGAQGDPATATSRHETAGHLSPPSPVASQSPEFSGDGASVTALAGLGGEVGGVLSQEERDEIRLGEAVGLEAIERLGLEFKKNYGAEHRLAELARKRYLKLKKGAA